MIDKEAVLKRDSHRYCVCKRQIDENNLIISHERKLHKSTSDKNLNFPCKDVIIKNRGTPPPQNDAFFNESPQSQLWRGIMRCHVDKNRAEVFRVVFMRVCGIYGQNGMLKKSRKREVFPNPLFRPHGYWAERGCCWNGLPDEKGIETHLCQNFWVARYHVGMVSPMRRGLKRNVVSLEIR